MLAYDVRLLQKVVVLPTSIKRHRGHLSVKWDFWLLCLSQPNVPYSQKIVISPRLSRSLGEGSLVDTIKTMRFTAKIVIYQHFIAVVYLYDFSV